MPIINIPDWQISDALNHYEIMHKLQEMAMIGWTFEFRRDEKQSAFEFTARYKHFFKSRKFIEIDPFFDWAAKRMIDRVYAVMNEYKWQFPAFQQILDDEEEWLKVKGESEWKS